MLFAYFDACCDAGADGPPLPSLLDRLWLAGCWLLARGAPITLPPSVAAGPLSILSLVGSIGDIFWSSLLHVVAFDVAFCSVTNVYALTSTPFMNILEKKQKQKR